MKKMKASITFPVAGKKQLFNAKAAPNLRQDSGVQDVRH